MIKTFLARYNLKLKSLVIEGFYNIVINTHGGSTNKRRKTKKVSKRFFMVVRSNDVFNIIG